MDSQNYPRRVEQDVSVQKLAGETLVYDERRHLAFCLDQVASAVWLQCDGTRTIAQIAMQTSMAADVVGVALAQLEQDSLLQVADIRYAQLGAISRRSLLGKLGGSAMVMLPVVTMLATPKAAEAYNGCADCTSSAQAAKRNVSQVPSPAPATLSNGPSMFKP